MTIQLSWSCLIGHGWLRWRCVCPGSSLAPDSRSCSNSCWDLWLLARRLVCSRFLVSSYFGFLKRAAFYLVDVDELLVGTPDLILTNEVVDVAKSIHDDVGALPKLFELFALAFLAAGVIDPHQITRIIGCSSDVAVILEVCLSYLDSCVLGDLLVESIEDEFLFGDILIQWTMEFRPWYLLNDQVER